MSNFKDYPPSIAELRSDKTRDAKDWTPRDALISMLRSIDRGEVKPFACVVICSHKLDDDSNAITYRLAAQSTYEALGVLEYGKRKIMNDTDLEL